MRAAYARQVLHRDVLTGTKAHRREYLPTKGVPEPPKIPSVKRNVLDDRICIVGAGTCGLYMAMALKRLGFTNVTILEATDNVGGRCFMWPKTEPPHEDGSEIDHFCYDVGAMRIPPLPWMEGQAFLSLFPITAYDI
jgi:hypothetical protein